MFSKKDDLMNHTTIAYRLHQALRANLRLKSNQCSVSHRGTYSTVSVPGMDITVRDSGSFLFTMTKEKAFLEVDLMGILAAASEARN